MTDLVACPNCEVAVHYETIHEYHIGETPTYYCDLCLEVVEDLRNAERAYETIREAFPGSMGGYDSWRNLAQRHRDCILTAWRKRK